MGAIFETVMLVCFGLSWPINVVKAYKTQTTKGTSLPFIFLIIAGYIAGITAKIITEQINYVLVVYIINLIIVMLNVVVYIRPRRGKKRTAAAEYGNDSDTFEHDCFLLFCQWFELIVEYNRLR